MAAMLWRHVVIKSDNYPRLLTPSFICRLVTVTTKLLVFFTTHLFAWLHLLGLSHATISIFLRTRAWDIYNECMLGQV